MSGSFPTDRRNGHTKAKVLRSAFVAAKKSPGQSSLHVVPKGKSKSMLGCCSRGTALLSMILGNANNRRQCDGQRHSCQRCMRRNLTCVYNVEPDISRLTSLRRKYSVLQIEVNQLRQLVEHIRTCSDLDLCNILRPIRTSNEPFDIEKLLDVTPAL